MEHRQDPSNPNPCPPKLASLLGVLFFCIATACLSVTGLAADYPDRPVRLIVAHPAGSQVDTVGRMLTQRLAEVWGQPIVVENRAGAGGTLAAAAVAKAKPDGYTLLLSTNAVITSNFALFKLDFRAEDFEVAAVVLDGGMMVLVNPKTGITSIAKLIERVKDKPGLFSAGTGGNGSIGHMWVTAFNKKFGQGRELLVHVPYKGSPAAAIAAATDVIQMAVVDFGAAMPFIKDGRLLALGFGNSRRALPLPEVPTLQELGIEGLDIVPWTAVSAPRGIPRELLRKINVDVHRLMQEPKLREQLMARGMRPVDPMTPESTGEFFSAEVLVWQQRVKEAGLKPE